MIQAEHLQAIPADSLATMLHAHMNPCIWVFFQVLLDMHEISPTSWPSGEGFLLGSLLLFPGLVSRGYPYINQQSVGTVKAQIYRVTCWDSTHRREVRLNVRAFDMSVLVH